MANTRDQVLAALADTSRTTQAVFEHVEGVGYQGVESCLFALMAEGRVTKVGGRHMPAGQKANVWTIRRADAPPRPDHTPWLGWTEERERELRQLASEGKSAAEIARVFGCTRNTVLGKANRKALVLGGRRACLPSPPSRGRENQFAGINAARKIERTAHSLKVNGAPPVLSVVGGVQGGPRISDDGFKGCRWPVEGEGDQTCFCCRPKVRGAYCSAHARLAYQPQSSKQVERDKGLARLVRRFA